MAISVEPKTGATPAPVEPTDSAKTASGLSDELLQIPAMQAVFAGSPAAVSASIKDFANRPEAKLIASHKDELLKAGMGLYRSLGGDLGVVFNQLKIGADQIKAADQAGKLLEIAPPFDVVNQQIAGSGENNPVLSANTAPPPAAGPAATGQTASPVRGPSAGSQKATTNARLKNQALGSPSSGPAPGAGRLLNNILKPVL